MSTDAPHIIQHTTQQSSVELTTNAKGAVQLGVKVYGDDPIVAADTAQRILDELLRKYTQPPARDITPAKEG